MSTPTPDGLKQEIDAGNLRTGNFVRDANNLNICTSITQLYVDAESKLAESDAATINQPTASVELFDLRGTGATGVLTNTFVGAATVTTATIAGYIRVKVTNAGTGFTSGSYYSPVYTLA